MTRMGNQLQLRNGDSLVDDLIANEGGGFLMPDLERTVSFSIDSEGRAVAVTVTNFDGRNKSVFPRICGLLAKLNPRKDPDSKRGAEIQRMIQVTAKGGAELSGLDFMSAGTKKDWQRGIQDTAGMEFVGYLGEEEVAGRNIARHGSPVARVAEYKVKKDGKERSMIVYFTADGVITDLDVVTGWTSAYQSIPAD